MKSVSGKALAKVLEDHGWTCLRMRGSHRTYGKPNCKPITLPVHGNRSLATGLQRAIMKAAGLSESDL